MVYAGRKVKYPVEDLGQRQKMAVKSMLTRMIQVFHCQNLHLAHTKNTRKRDRVLTRKRKKEKSNGHKFRQSLSTFNSFQVTSTDSDDESSYNYLFNCVPRVDPSFLYTLKYASGGALLKNKVISLH